MTAESKQFACQPDDQEQAGRLQDASRLDRCLQFFHQLPCIGILTVLLAECFVTVAAFSVKHVANMNPIVIASFSAFVQMSVCSTVVLLRRQPFLGVTDERRLMVASAVFTVAANSLISAAYQMASLSDATTINSTSPVFVVLIACVFLKQERSTFNVLALLPLIIGVMLISRPSFIFRDTAAASDEDKAVWGLIAAGVSSLCYASSAVVMRRMHDTPSVVIVNWQAMLGVAAGIGFVAVIEVVSSNSYSFWPSSASELCWLSAVGLSGAAGHFLVALALKLEEATIVCMTRSSGIVMSFVTQALLLPSEPVLWSSLAGAVVIIMTICLVTGKRISRQADSSNAGQE